MISDSQFIEKLELLKKQIDAQAIIVTRSTGGKTQSRVTGKNEVKNPFGHGGKIGVLLDFVVLNGMSGRFTLAEIESLCLTKRSKVASHFNNELAKKYGMKYALTKTDTGKVEFHFDSGVSGTVGCGHEIQQRYLQLTSAPRLSADEKQAIIRKTRIR